MSDLHNFQSISDKVNENGLQILKMN